MEPFLVRGVVHLKAFLARLLEEHGDCTEIGVLSCSKLLGVLRGVRRIVKQFEVLAWIFREGVQDRDGMAKTQDEHFEEASGES